MDLQFETPIKLPYILETIGLTVNQIPINWTLTIINHWSGIRCFKSVPGFLSWLLLSHLWGSGHETPFTGGVMIYVSAQVKQAASMVFRLFASFLRTKIHSSSILFTMCCIVGKLNHTKLVTNDLKRHIETQRSTGCQWKLAMPFKP